MKQIHFDTIDSTNTYLKNNYQNLDDMTFVSATSQSSGRGRNNRTWLDDGNNLLFSLLIKNDYLMDSYKILSILSAYSIIEVLETYGINNLSIKWPNDVYADDNKICGILLESVSKEKLECLIIGVGLNVNQDIFEGEFIHQPTSMKNILNINIDIEELKKKIYERFIDNLNKLKNNYYFYDDIAKYDYLKDKQVYALINNDKCLVNVLGINDDYSLRIKYEDKIENIETGEISFHI